MTVDYEKELERLGKAWFHDENRPRLVPETVQAWQLLISGWIMKKDIPLLVRKGQPRGVLVTHEDDRGMVRCDNSPAHWVFMGCIRNVNPAKIDFMKLLKEGEKGKGLPVSMVLDEPNSQDRMGVTTANSTYGRLQDLHRLDSVKYPAEKYKLCHIDSVGLKLSKDPTQIALKLLKNHMWKLLDPANMFVLPIEYGGIGECNAFIRGFTEAEAAARKQ